MRFSVPHPIPYQGSKRRLALAILSHVEPNRYKRLVEPFAGSAAVTLAAAKRDFFPSLLLADKLLPLVKLWSGIIDKPGSVADEYEALWRRERDHPIAEYYAIRSEFNEEQDPTKLLYLLARCVKNAVRFNPSGEFNQSPDKRRKGTHPDSMRRELWSAHRLLVGRTEVICSDFMNVIEKTRTGDFVYLDPPYQGTSDGRDSRYISGVSRERIIEGLQVLNKREVPFILSYDGSCGQKIYGDRLPADIATRILINVGRSSQSTLNGADRVTIESLYVSYDIAQAEVEENVLTLSNFMQQRSMTFA